MGQYYIVVNLDKKEYIHPFRSCSDFNGMKLMEHSYIGNSLLNIITRIVKTDGNWNQDRIVWAGDYAEDGLFLNEDKNMNLHRYALNNFKELKVKSLNKSIKKCKYFINDTRKEYINLSEFENKDKLNVHPVSLLLASGNGQGCGDYSGPFEKYVGTWAGDRIRSIQNMEGLEGYKEIKSDFMFGF